ncbi:uncharacterized protein PAC_04549 [Phialocephala subalpina]|uniref:Uncharacterized protein n=1 Tax=Phialocephala subalpina TaxID=576137 RepID=A0A1L7WPG8_9HELO|nr:uncharacterized protein PAC_04549 [Phialocephala subalpina]
MSQFTAMDLGGVDAFHEHEKRFMLAEALKRSKVPIDKLLVLLQESGQQQPDWDNMYLPPGRTLNQCRTAFESLRSAYPPPSFQAPIPHVPNVQNIQIPRKRPSDTVLEPYMGMQIPPGKRRQSGMEAMAGSREILPKPPNGGSPISTASSPAPPQQKRRGRPPKTEVERRNRDAIQRGDVFPAQLPSQIQPHPEEFATSPYAAIAPARGPPTPQGPIEHTMLEMQADDSPGKKKRQRGPAKPLKPPPAKHPGESSFSVNPQIPMVSEPQARAQVPSIANIADILQPSPVPQPSSGGGMLSSPLPPANEPTTSAAAQPPTDAAS